MIAFFISVVVMTVFAHQDVEFNIHWECKAVISFCRNVNGKVSCMVLFAAFKMFNHFDEFTEFCDVQHLVTINIRGVEGFHEFHFGRFVAVIFMFVAMFVMIVIVIVMFVIVIVFHHGRVWQERHV